MFTPTGKLTSAQHNAKIRRTCLARDIKMPKHGNCGKRPYYYAPPTASANWRYITDADEDRTGPRKNEIMLSTMDAKKAFALETSDISALTGLRHPQSGYRSGSTLTKLYFNIL